MTPKPARKPLPGGRHAYHKPLPDPPQKTDMRQSIDVVRAHSILGAYFRRLGRTDVLVNGNGYLCFNTRTRSNVIVPDCVVAFGVDPQAIADHNGYEIDLVGKPPEFALEVAPRTTGRRDYAVKPGMYAALGVGEYWRFDHTGGRFHDEPLAGDLLVGGAYQPIGTQTDAEGVVWGRSPALGIDLCWYHGTLRFYDPVNREYLPELIEAMAQRDEEAQARAAAEAELQRLRDLLRRRPAE